MTYVLIASDKDINTLIPVNQTALSLQQVFNDLLAGTVIVVSKYEQTQGKDVFVQLTKDTPQLTQISYTPPASAAWQPFPLPINALTLYRVYEYDATLYGNVVFQVGDTIRYEKNNVLNADVVQAVYKDSDGIYYQLGGSLYEVGTIPDPVVTDFNISGNINVISPVADPTANYHTIDVSDYKDKIYVVY